MAGCVFFFFAKELCKSCLGTGWKRGRRVLADPIGYLCEHFWGIVGITLGVHGSLGFAWAVPTDWSGRETCRVLADSLFQWIGLSFKLLSWRLQWSGICVRICLRSPGDTVSDVFVATKIVYLYGKLDHLHPLLWQPKQIFLLGQTVVFFLQVFFVRKPNQSISTAL